MSGLFISIQLPYFLPANDTYCHLVITTYRISNCLEIFSIKNSELALFSKSFKILNLQKCYELVHNILNDRSIYL